MRVRWYGQAAFGLEDGDGKTVFLDPFQIPGAALAGRGLRFDYPPITGALADLVLVTHEHFDHNGVDAIEGATRVIRATAGRFETALGPVTGVVTDHDRAAGTERGANIVYVFSLEGLRVCHFGDYGQAELRPEQAEAIGTPDLLFLPVGGGPTVDGAAAIEVVRRLRPRWVVPMHYRTSAINFLDPVDAFLAGLPRVHRLDAAAFDTADLPATDAGAPLVVVPAVPI